MKQRVVSLSDLSKAAVSIGISGLFIEVHDDPDNAPSDGPNMLKLSELGEMREGKYANLSYPNLGFKEENDAYYQTINNIENDLINNLNFNDIIKKYRLKIESIEKINKNGLNQERIKSTKNYFSNAIFKLDKNFNTEIFDLNGTKYLVNLSKIEKKTILKFNDQLKREIEKIINLLKKKQLSEKIINRKRIRINQRSR